ncbi:hypothetical protein ACUNV4_22390 [Granulosicoccus sp. 3-233]|uniref:hypothetical protein n=1 Tax=Granulosicoccus sp. 3-233 TaxID=3417969 RepID=UPI003D33AB65
MESSTFSRRAFLGSAGLGVAALVAGRSGLISSVQASNGLPPTESMRGGSNNYSPGAPLVDNLGSGFLVHGTVRHAGAGDPLANVRIQIWAATARGGEREPSNHGSVLTAADGSFQLEMSQIVPNFGQPHAHLAYDDADFKTVFLRPVMSSPQDTSVQAHFVLVEA